MALPLDIFMIYTVVGGCNQLTCEVGSDFFNRREQPNIWTANRRGQMDGPMDTHRTDRQTDGKMGTQVVD